MNFLVIETSSEKSFALLSVAGVISYSDLPNKQQRDCLLPTIDSLLKSTNLQLKNLDFIGVGNGPGSFTGTRIGVLTAKALSLGNDLPLITFCSLFPYTPSIPTPFLLLINANSHGFYAYDGAEIKLIDTLPNKGNLYSSHPERIPVPTIKAVFNLPLLLLQLKTSFLNGNIVSHSAVKVCYLHSP